MAQSSKVNLLLMELIISILFFCVSSAICVQVFATSYQKSQESVDRNVALLQAQTVAELYQSSLGDISILIEELQLSKTAEYNYEGFFKSNGQFSKEDDAEYSIKIVETKTDTISWLDIDVFTKNGNELESIFTLRTSDYQQISKGEVSNE